MTESSAKAYKDAAPARITSSPAGDLSSLLGSRLAELLERPSGTRRTRVLLVGNYGNGNTGDEAILAGVLQVMPPHVAVSVVSRRPEIVAELHGVKSVRTLSLRSLYTFLRSDVLLIGGGGMFGRGLPPLVAVLPLVALSALALGKQLGFVAIGAYGDTPRLPLACLRSAASRAQLVTVRDYASRDVLTTVRKGRTRIPTVVGDPATWVVPSPSRELVDQGLLPDGPRPLVVSLKAVPDEELRQLVCDAMAEGLAAARRTANIPLVFLCLSDQGDYGLGPAMSDRALAQRVIDAGDLHEQSIVIGPGLPPAQAKAVIAHARGVIAMRLHAQIFAESTGVNYLAIAFEQKTHAWAAERDAQRLSASDISPRAIADWCTEALAADTTIGDDH